MTDRPSVTVVNAGEGNSHVEWIIEAFDKRGINVSRIDLDPSMPISSEVKKFGDVTIWRSSSLSLAMQRPAIERYLDHTYMINEAVFVYPSVVQKYYQQQVVAATPSLRKYAIPTYIAKRRSQVKEMVERGELSYPFIAKPNNGSKGVGVRLIRNFDELHTLERPLGEHVLQNFITNNGDWRVIVLGGRPVGAIKRIAAEGDFLNNISRGGRAVKEDDPVVLREITDIAVKVAGLFRLRLCGVDIIRDEQTGELHVLEVNTVPQWDKEHGFDSVADVSVADELAEYVEGVLREKNGADFVDVVHEYYKKHIEYYPYELFHYASRLWLWSHDQWARGILDDIKEWYIGADENQYRQKLETILGGSDSVKVVNQRQKPRQKYREIYQKIPQYNSILFKVLFAETLYGVDLRSIVRDIVSTEDLIQLHDALRADHDAIRVLSTHAMNYMYLLRYYLQDEGGNDRWMSPEEIEGLCEGYGAQVATGELSVQEARKYQIYLLTHAIIGESQFYNRAVTDDKYQALCRRIEQVITDAYFDVSLDNKCEFLVCAKLCGYTTSLRPIILQEAESSRSWAGSFIVDAGAPGVRHNMRTSEHRNVLYVMSTQDDESLPRGGV